MSNSATESDPVVIHIINLWSLWGNCGICNKDIRVESRYYLPMWCERIVPDNLLDEIDWAGVPVCKECYEHPPQDRYLRRK